MATTMEEFMPKASSEQLAVLDRIVELGDQEKEAHQNYTQQQAKIDQKVSRIKSEWGIQSNMVDADLELFVDPMLPERDGYLREFEKVRSELKDLFCQAVTELNMGHLGFIQRHYETVVGEPMPDSYSSQERNST